MRRSLLLDSLGSMIIVATDSAPEPIVEHDEKKRVNKYSGKPDPEPFKRTHLHIPIQAYKIMRDCKSVTISKDKKNVNRPPGHKRRKNRG